MTQDIASLGIKVETGDVAKASTELDGLAQAGAKAEKATEGLGGESKKASVSIKAMAAETKAAEAATAKLGKQTDAVGVSAKQTAAALRGVPAQVTDIVTSLQGGQAPLTVLLQQGGQLKDMFGGVGPAAKALGGYVAGLVNPFTVAAASAAALGVVYYKGSQEADAYSKALILTGNAAGTSADQLSSLARQVSATVGTTGAAAEVLAQLAGSGNLAAYSFEEITKSALTMKDATGKAVEETVAQFASIAKEPVAASIKLNEQYHYLTASVYEQIVALEKQGRQAEAVRVATDAFAEVIEGRGDQITKRLGSIERAWNNVAKAAKWAWDAALDVGREATYEEKLANLEEAAKNAARLGAGPRGTGAQGLQSIEAQRTSLMLEEQERRNRVQARKDDQDANERSVQARQRLNVLIDKGKSLAQQTADAYEKINKDAAEAARKGTAYSADQIAQAKKTEFERINGKPTKGGGAKQLDMTGFNDAQNSIKLMQATYSNSEKELEAQQKAGLITQQNYLDQRTALIRAEREEVSGAYKAEIAALEALMAKSSTTGEQRIQLGQKIADAKQAMVKSEKDADSQLKVLAINEEGRVTAQTAASKAYVDQLERQRAALEVSGARAANGLGLGDRQQGLQNNLDGATDKFNEERAKLLDRRRTAPDKYSKEDYEKDLASLQTAEDRYRATVVGNYDKMSVAQSNWQSGATSAYANYLQSASDVAGQTKSLFTNAFSEMDDALANFALSGKLSFGDLAKSIIADMARIATKQASSSALSGLFGLATTAAQSYFGGSSGSTQAGYTGSDYSNWLKTQAKGGAWSGGVQMFADGGAFTNSIVSKPTAFGMANGKPGVMGEAGPEAIVPLARDSQGRLGIRGGSSATPITMTFYIDAADNGASTIPDPAKLAEAMKAVAQQEIARQRRNGGQLA
jgi:lambda family phage tail tape measure protein